MRGCASPQSKVNFTLSLFSPLHSSGRGSAWLERLVRDQEVGGSNPLAPTTLNTLPFIDLRNILRNSFRGLLWTNVDQVKA
jgi:hypothetical protein